MRGVKRWYNRSIRNKLAVVVLLAVIPSVLVASVLGAVREADQQRVSRQNEFQGIAAALAATVSEPLGAGERRQVANALKGIGAIPGLKHVSVRDETGATVFHFGNGILVSNGVAETSLFSLGTFPVSADIRHAGTVIGTLFLVADISGVRDALWRSLAAALFAGIFAALAGIVASYRMQRAVSSPIAALTSAIRQVRDRKDFTQTVTRTSHDETGVLVEAFNEMLSEIKTRDAALSAYSQGLEVQVAERTRDLAAAVDAAEAANLAKSEFLATMSHEIRTPMNGMLVMAELLAASELTPRAQRQCEVILRSGQTLLSIINDILDLSKIEAGHLELERVDVDPRAIVDDVIALYAERASGKGLQLAAYVSPAVPSSIVADPVRLSQILSNLVNNALKFTERGGVLVRVDPGREPATLRFAVTDTGIGIPADKLATIFDPFTQAEQSTTRRFGGTGIGLTICRRLVGAMGGVLRVDSALGCGSTFTFDVPVDALAMRQPPSAGAHGSGSLLLLLPEGPSRTALSLFAADAGLATLDAGPMGQAGDRPPDLRLVITDVAHLERAVATGADGGVPLILLSPLGESSGDRHLREGRVQHVLDIPFGSREARDAIARALAGQPPAVVAPPLAARSQDPAPSFAGIRVLAADDSAVNREVLIEALRRLHIDVECVEDGAAAVAAVTSGRFDLVFMDGSMPGMDGFEATRAIRAWEIDTGRAALPVVGLSAHVVGARADLWRDCGMSDFIAKPFTLAAIRRCLERWVGDARHSPDPHETRVDGRDHPPAVAADRPLVDPDVLRSIRDMQSPGDDLVGRVIGLYAAHAPRLLERLLDCALRPDDATALAAAAHALKSLNRNVGAIRLGDMCGAIEDAARAGQPVSDSLFAALADMLPPTIDALQSACAESAAA